MTAPATSRKSKRSRTLPSPNSVLDQDALELALEANGIAPLKPAHWNAFYGQLHRQNYPPLPEFVDNYYPSFFQDTISWLKVTLFIS